jgi:hypothetical protein
VLALVVGFLFGGYVFVYAAVANGGKLAANPWQALYVDAYAADGASASGGGSGSGVESTLKKIFGFANNFIHYVPGPWGFLP